MGTNDLNRLYKIPGPQNAIQMLQSSKRTGEIVFYNQFKIC